MYLALPAMVWKPRHFPFPLIEVAVAAFEAFTFVDVFSLTLALTRRSHLSL